MQAKNRFLLIVRTFFALFLVITITGCNASTGKIENSKNNEDGHEIVKEQDVNTKKDNYDITRDNLKIDFNNNLDNDKLLKNVIYDCFYKYYGIMLPKDKDNIFTINRVVDTTTNEIIINASYIGEIEKQDYYLNIVINQTNRCMERIDSINYSIKDNEKEISQEEAERIAEEYLMIVDKEKYKSTGTIRIIKNLRDGYQLIFTDKNNEKNIIIISVNPYSLQVTSCVIYWV